MRSRWCLAATLCLVAAGIGLSGAKAAAVDVKYVSSDFCAAIVVAPQRIAKSPMVAPLLKQEQVAAKLQSVGLDPQNIQQLMLLITPPGKSPGTPDAPGIVIRFAEPVDTKAILTKFRAADKSKGPGEIKDVTIQGKPCWEFQADLKGVAYAPDDRTLMLSDGNVLAKMFLADGAKSPLIDKLNQLDANSDVAVVVALDPLRSTITTLTSVAAMQAPTALAEFLKIPGLSKMVTLNATLAGENLLTAAIEANDADGAVEIEKLLKKAVNLAKLSLAAARLQSAGDNGSEKAKTADDPLEVAQQAIDGITILRAESLLTITMKKPAGLEKTITKGLNDLTPAAKPPARALRMENAN
jgi:hypothetical protein